MQRLSFLTPNPQSLYYHISVIHSLLYLVAALIFRISKKNFYPELAPLHYDRFEILTYDDKGADIVVLVLENVVQNKQTHTWERIETV